VAVATFSFTRFAQLQKCLAGVLGNSVTPDEVLVVVDGNPSLAEALKVSWSDTRITILESEGRGISAARNTALHHATGELLVFIDDDVWPDPDWLRAIVGTLCRQGVAAVGGRILPDYSPGARILPPELLWLVGCTYRGHPTERGPITRPIGSTMAFRRSALAVAGGFNPAFGTVGLKRVNSNDELPLARIVHRQFGPGSIWFEPDATVHHWVPPERSGLRWVLRRSWVEGRSKAAVRAEESASVMTHDKSYVTSTLLPRTARYLLSGSTSDWRFAGRMVTAGTITALSFGFGRARFHMGVGRRRMARPIGSSV
jgi:glycosyltransferase involved in cell wall biosynthesis